MILNGLCAGGLTSYLPDILAIGFFLLMIVVSARRGFVGCILNIVSSLLAIILAVALASAVVDGTGGLFGLQSSMTKSPTKTFLKVDGFGVDVSQTGVEAALQQQNVSAILARLVLKVAGKQEEIAAGTTLAQLLGEATGSLAARLIAGIVLFIAIKITVRLLRGLLTSLVEKIPLLGSVNRILGAVFGGLYALIIVSAVLALLAVVPVEGISTFLSKSLLVGFLYEHNILVIMLSWFL